jgi:hypothetical protein
MAKVRPPGALEIRSKNGKEPLKSNTQELSQFRLALWQLKLAAFLPVYLPKPDVL